MMATKDMQRLLDKGLENSLRDMNSWWRGEPIHGMLLFQR